MSGRRSPLIQEFLPFMFDLFRSREKSVRILLGVLLGVVALGMLVYLIPGGFGNDQGATGQNVVASVGKEKITTDDVQRALQSISRGQQLPPGILGMYTPMLVNQLIEAKAVAFKAREMGLKVSDQELGDAIQNEFTSQLGTQFDMKVYQQVLSQQGLTVPQFEQRQRDGMLAARLENIEAQSLLVSDADAKAEYKRKNEKVALRYLNFESKDFTGKVSKDPTLVKAYFEKNRAAFRTPEKRDIDLIAGTASDFARNAIVNDSELQRAYQDGLDSYRQPEKVVVRHILIKTQGKPKEEWPKLKAKAEELLGQLRGGADFAELAKKNSEDTGSAVKGGDLGPVVKGQTVPAFEKAAFSLKPGELSSVVETEYGYHILQVQSRQDAHTQTFEEVRPQLVADAQKQFGAESLKKNMDAARNEVTKNPAQAQAIAKKYNLTFSRMDNFATGSALPNLNAPDAVNAIFAAPKGSVTEVVDTPAQGKASFAVIRNVTPAKNAEYGDVQAAVLQKYTESEALRLSQEAAKASADRARKGESLEEIAKPYGLSVKAASPFTMDGAAEGIGAGSLLSAAFQGKPGDIIGPVAGASGQVVAKVSEQIGADMTQFAKNKDSIVQSLQQQRQTVQQPLFRDSIVSELKRRGKVSINQDTLNRLMGSYKS